MSPTFFSDIYIGITATITATLPPHYRQNNICTDILHRHLHRQNSINLQRSQTSAKLITFPKLSQKGKNKEDLRRNGDYTLLYIGILWENGGDNIIEYQQLKRFIVQVEAISLCKLRISHKKWCSIPQNETPLI